MSIISNSRAYASANLAEGSISDSVEVAASPERVFRALHSKEIIDWWIRPGVFDTTEWTGDVRVGGRWRAVGTGNRRPFAIEGEFLEIDSPRKLVLTWHAMGMRSKPTILTFLLERIDGGTRLTLHQTGFAAPDWCINTSLGWETSFERLAEILPARTR
jgi:uncharacterized protein YndB with AHSA1/START domain